MKKLVVYLFTVLFVLVAVFCIWRDTVWEGEASISALIPGQAEPEEVRCWQEDRDEFYLFLPSYADLEQIQLKTNVSNTVYLNGNKMVTGMTAQGLQWGVPYDLCYLNRGKENHCSLTFLRSENVPALYIDTASGAMDHIHEVKGNEEPGTLRLYTADGSLDYSGNLESIKGRGNSTWNHEKKPYNLTLSTDGDLLNMGEAKRWILLANAEDPSNLKNKLAYDFARDAGLAYTPECQWTELYLNGEYVGLYLLSERNEVHPQRVNIPQEGSFLVVKDWEWRFRKTGAPFIMTQDKAALRLYYSDLPETEVLDIFQSAENAILAEHGIDPVTGKHWQELIDLDSWARRYLVEEILGNVDASILSQFFYYDGSDPEGKIYGGPIWDMDLSMRLPREAWLQKVDQFYGNKPHIYGSHWLNVLYKDPLFYEYLTEVYSRELAPLLAQLRDQGVEKAYRHIWAAAQNNALRWRMEPAEEERDAILQFLTRRMEFLDKVWTDGEAYVTVTVIDVADNIRSIVIPQGTCIPDLPDYEEDETVRVLGWAEYPNYAPFDVTQPVWEDIAIDILYIEEAAQPAA